MPALFIDSSYVSFQCFFRTKKWFVSNHPKVSIENIEWHNVRPFMKKYEQNYNQIIRRIVRNRSVPWTNVIIVKDCPRSEIWRHDIYSEYKATREENNKHFTGGLVFKYTHHTIFPFFETTYGVSNIRFDRAEADDVIYVLHSQYRKQFPNDNVYILTVDSDYVQLLDEHTKIINVYNTVIKNIERTEEYTLYKILNGDKSDNIRKCFGRKVTKEMCNRFVSNPSSLVELLEKNHKARKQYDLNMKLIKFKNIPESIQKQITEWCESSWLCVDSNKITAE